MTKLIQLFESDSDSLVVSAFGNYKSNELPKKEKALLNLIIALRYGRTCGYNYSNLIDDLMEFNESLKKDNEVKRTFLNYMHHSCELESGPKTTICESIVWRLADQIIKQDEYYQRSQNEGLEEVIKNGKDFLRNITDVTENTIKSGDYKMLNIFLKSLLRNKERYCLTELADKVNKEDITSDLEGFIKFLRNYEVNEEAIRNGGYHQLVLKGLLEVITKHEESYSLKELISKENIDLDLTSFIKFLKDYEVNEKAINELSYYRSIIEDFKIEVYPDHSHLNVMRIVDSSFEPLSLILMINKERKRSKGSINKEDEKRTLRTFYEGLIKKDEEYRRKILKLSESNIRIGNESLKDRINKNMLLYNILYEDEAALKIEGSLSKITPAVIKEYIKLQRKLDTLYSLQPELRFCYENDTDEILNTCSSTFIKFGLMVLVSKVIDKFSNSYSMINRDTVSPSCISMLRRMCKQLIKEGYDKNSKSFKERLDSLVSEKEKEFEARIKKLESREELNILKPVEDYLHNKCYLNSYKFDKAMAEAYNEFLKKQA